MKHKQQLSLFEQEFSKPLSLLPHDGCASYFGRVMSEEMATHYFNELLTTIPWQHDQVSIAGKLITTTRQVAWFGNKTYAYRYSGGSKTALIWTKTLLELKHLVEQQTGKAYNSCLLNLYVTGLVGMAWHSDKEYMLIKNGSIASLSLGAERVFAFKKIDNKQTINCNLQHGSLLEMKGGTQEFWQHSLLKSTKEQEARINLTFRQILD